MKKFNFLVLLSLLLVGCSSTDNTNEKEIIKEKEIVEEGYLEIDLSGKKLDIEDLKEMNYTKNDLGLGDSIIDDVEMKYLYGKENYNYEDFLKYEEYRYTIDYFQKNEIYYGEELNQQEDKYLVLLFSPLCEFSLKMVNELIEYEKSDNALKIYKMNLSVYDNEAFINPNIHEIEGTPTLLLIDKEKGIESKITGFQSSEELINLINL